MPGRSEGESVPEEVMLRALGHLPRAYPVRRTLRYADSRCKSADLLIPHLPTQGRLPADIAALARGVKRSVFGLRAAAEQRLSVQLAVSGEEVCNRRAGPGDVTAKSTKLFFVLLPESNGFADGDSDFRSGSNTASRATCIEAFSASSSARVRVGSPRSSLASWSDAPSA
jgi:hypothetical protein